jgi:hypothetical protein
MGSFLNPIVSPALSSPQAQATINSQLSPLDNSAYSFSSMSYPIDLGNDPAVNHYVLFYINETTDTNYPTGKGTNLNGQQVPQPLQDQRGTVQGIQSTINLNAKSDSRPSSPSLNIPHRTTRVPLGIALYMPPEIATVNETPWAGEELGLAGAFYQDFFKSDKGSLMDHLAAFAKDLAADIGHDLGLGLGNLSDLITGGGGKGLNAAGTVGFAARAAFNPHAEVLFRGVRFRSFNFKWQFFPRSEDEAQAVYNIIQAFKFYAAPEVNLGLAGRFFLYPAEFDIKFFSNGQPNNFLNKISTCALVNVGVNYTGNGMFSAFSPGTNGLNGVTTQTQLSLDFIELEIMHKKRILEGY